MILKLRIDERLLHGQVAYSWKAALAYDAIVIASDEAAADDLRKTTIKLCCPDGVKLATRSIEDAAKLLKNDKLAKMKVFVIVANPKSAQRLLELIDDKPVVNLGGMQKEDHKVFFSKAVYVGKEDLEYLDIMNEKGYKIEVQEVPSTSVLNFNDLRKKVTL